MRLLLDTHALLWYLTTPEKLPAAAHRAIQAADNEVYASLASAWEISIKVAIGRLDLDRKSTRLNSSHSRASRMPSSA